MLSKEDIFNELWLELKDHKLNFIEKHGFQIVKHADDEEAIIGIILNSKKHRAVLCYNGNWTCAVHINNNIIIPEQDTYEKLKDAFKWVFDRLYIYLKD